MTFLQFSCIIKDIYISMYFIILVAGQMGCCVLYINFFYSATLMNYFIAYNSFSVDSLWIIDLPGMVGRIITPIS